MLAKLEALRRPVSVKGRLVVGPDGVTRIRNTGLLAADIAFELGPMQCSDEDVLAQHPELERADLDAVRQHDHAPIEFDALIGRVVGPNPSHDDVLDAYLFLPRIVRSFHQHPNMATPLRLRSSFEAAYTDVANVDPSWIKTIGTLTFLDQIGTALRREDHEDITRTWKLSSVERALERFTDLPETQRAVLWALRNALAHDFSLINPRAGNTPRDVALRHTVKLDHASDGSLITLPTTPWNGEFDVFHATLVNTGRLTELVAEARERIYECYDDGTLRLALTPEETRRRYIFVHGASIEEWNEQRRADVTARWRRQ